MSRLWRARKALTGGGLDAMSGTSCEEMRLLVQADVDGELSPAEAARVAAHVGGCASCAETEARLLALRARLRREVPPEPAPEALRAKVRASIAGLLPAEPVVRAAPPWRAWVRQGVGFGAGAALAAGVALAVLPHGGGDASDALVANHIRALQPGHLMDVVSTDQHTVKPWFDGTAGLLTAGAGFRCPGFSACGRPA